MKAWDELERKKRAKVVMDDFTPDGKSDIGDSAIVELRNKVLAAIRRTAPRWNVTEIDHLLAEFADGLIDRERGIWQEWGANKWRETRREGTP